MTLTLEDKILLQFGDERKHLQPHEIDADRTNKEIAISNLVRLGYATAHENANTKYDRYISISITAEGKARQRELKRLLDRSRSERFRDAIKDILHLFRPSFGRIVEGIIIAVVSGMICFWIGRASATNESDNSSDNRKQEQTDNPAVALD